MLPLRFNADYELDLFFNKKAPPILNESLEFLLFFLTDRVVFTNKNYSDDYLSYLKRLGINPQTTNIGSYENYWGKLQDRELERKLNSKLTSTEFQIDSVIINNHEELKKIPCDGSYLIKDPYGMSGQNIFRLLSYNDARRFPLIAEKFRDRLHDFSLFKMPDNKVIFYENIVNEKFQYKGSIIQKECTLHDLKCLNHVADEEINRFKDKVELALNFYSKFEPNSCFSIDSFVYKDQDVLKIHDVCEVNYRKTMGYVAYELIKKYSPTKSGLLELHSVGSEPLYKLYEGAKDVLILSPGDTRFEILLRFTDENAKLDKEKEPSFLHHQH